jgi:hypothetical protein
MKIIHQSLAGLLQELRGRKVEQVRVAPLIKSFPDPSGLPRYARWVVVSAALVNLGVPERVAMTVTGHKSRAVFDRYHIVSPGDLQDVARRLAGRFSGTSGVSRLTPAAEPRNIPGAGG